MKKKFILIMILFSLLLSWCSELSNQSPRSITENIWSRTCTWKWVDKIEWYATCRTTDWWSYVWDIRWHKFNGKWKLITSDWETQDGYFYNWNIIAGKVTKNNGNAIKWLRRNTSGDANTLELWKIFQKNWDIRLWEFDIEWNFTYWLYYTNILNTSAYVVGKFQGNTLKTELYFIATDWCAKFSNWEYKEITRTITNTVYKNNWIQLSNPLGDFYKLWSQYNPYTVKLELK